jgi:hypothetical protein
LQSFELDEVDNSLAIALATVALPLPTAVTSE